MDLVNIPYVQARTDAKRQRPSTILLRVSDTTASAGAAKAISAVWHTQIAPSNTHYVVDSSDVVRTEADNRRDAFFLKGGISITVCSRYLEDPSDWFTQGSEQEQAWRKTANLIAALCVKHKIPLKEVNRDQMLNWAGFPTKRRGGLFYHSPSAKPGDFLSLVKEYRRKL